MKAFVGRTDYSMTQEGIDKYTIRSFLFSLRMSQGNKCDYVTDQFHTTQDNSYRSGSDSPPMLEFSAMWLYSTSFKAGIIHQNKKKENDLNEFIGTPTWDI